MTTAVTYPRISQLTAESLLTKQLKLSVVEVASLVATSHPQQEWHPTIPGRVTKEDLQNLRAAIVQLAAAHGYPEQLPRGGYALFDQELATYMYKRMRIVPAEAAAGGIWSFLALVLLPDVTAWRWPDRPRERFIGGEVLIGSNRHALGRLWARAHVLGGYLNAGLNEDNVVQILERSTFGGNPRLAQAIAKSHLCALETNPVLTSQALMRDAMKRLRRLAIIICFAALSDNQLSELLDEVFAASEAALGGS